jgi:RNA polymerase sigma-70 factor (ECF subfamily)
MLLFGMPVTVIGAVRSYQLEPVSSGRDVALMGRIASGDGDAFAELVKRYTRMLYNVAYRYNAAQAEDLVQEAFLRAFQHAGTFSGRSKVSSWLYRICVNVCLTNMGRSTLPTTDIDEVPESEFVAVEEERPDKRAERGETYRALEDGLRSLPSQQRMVFILRELQGLSYGEIADILGMNEQAARTNLHRAKRRLQTWLNPLLG